MTEPLPNNQEHSATSNHDMEPNKMDHTKMDIEDFIRDNRAAFDAYEPDPLLWQQIQTRLEPAAGSATGTRKARILQFMPPRQTMWRAAAAVVVLISAFFAIRMILPGDNAADATVAQVKLEEVSPQLAEADAYYTQQIEQKRQEIKTLAVSLKDPRAQQMCTHDFNSDIQQLDSMYTVLKHDLATQPAKDKVADAMIENLQLRIEILNQQLSILKKFNQTKQNEDENQNRAL
jgi:hypothetical protein